MKLIKPILIVLFFSISVQSCQMNQEKKTVDFEVSDSIKDFSFVVSCGSGCALTHDVNKLEKGENSIKTEFKVEMYVNEEKIEIYNVTYHFKIYPDKTILDESGNKVSSETHGILFNELIKIFDFIQ